MGEQIDFSEQRKELVIRTVLSDSERHAQLNPTLARVGREMGLNDPGAGELPVFPAATDLLRAVGSELIVRTAILGRTEEG